jgi:DNA-binding NarL/FixJ family response regulator
MIEIRHIAIVDDHTMVRKGLCSLINLFHPYQVLFDAENGKDMIQKINPAMLPDIVLLDITMPDMDGYAAAHWLKVHYPDVKVLALSTMDTEKAIIKMLKNGARGYILKDSDPAELKEAFDNVLKQGYYYNDTITHKLVNSLNKYSSEYNSTQNADHITPRESEFLQLACSEKTYQQIAADMKVSERTVEGYREALFKKFQVSTRVGLVIWAIKKDYVQI